MKSVKKLSPLVTTMICALALSGCALFVPLEKEPAISIRVHPQTSPTDSAKFAMPMRIPYQPFEIYLSRIPLISSEDIQSFQVVPSEEDDTYGALLYLGPHGRAALTQNTMANQKSYLVTFVQNRVVSTQYVDRPVKDGQFYIEKGLTPEDLKLMAESFEQVGSPKVEEILKGTAAASAGANTGFERVGDAGVAGDDGGFPTVGEEDDGFMTLAEEQQRRSRSGAAAQAPLSPTIPGTTPNLFDADGAAPQQTRDTPPPRAYERQRLDSGRTNYYRPPFQ